MGIAAFILSVPIHIYRVILSPWLGSNCRYQPSCSAYGLEALKKHGAVKGGYLALRRIFRCHPWGQSGYDPVPDKAPVKKMSPHKTSLKKTSPYDDDKK